jgi:CRP/FNR family transcriptional regulator
MNVASPQHPAFQPLHLASCQTACTSCNLREICLPLGLTRAELERASARLISGRRKVALGESLYRAGDGFGFLYAVWTGFFKTRVTSRGGREQVTGFQMAGEIIGLDGIAERRHEVDAVAIEDSQVCLIPFAELQTLAAEMPSLQQQLHRIMSGEIVRNHGVMMQLGSMYAEERLAAFLLNLTHRLRARGFSPSSVYLRMSREEIGSYLGLKVETVSRTFSKLQSAGLLFVRKRQIQIVDPLGLQALVDGASD